MNNVLKEFLHQSYEIMGILHEMYADENTIDYLIKRKAINVICIESPDHTHAFNVHIGINGTLLVEEEYCAKNYYIRCVCREEIYHIIDTLRQRDFITTLELESTVI